MSERAPDYSVAAIGYRVWGVKGLQLTGRYKSDQLWPAQPGEPMVARCPVCEWVEDPEGMPGEGCQCGVHANWRAEGLGATVPYEGQGFLAGAVACWGRIVPHWNCFRAQRAIPVALVGNSDWAKRIAHDLEVELVPNGWQFAEALREVALEYGQELPLDLRPDMANELLTHFVDGPASVFLGGRKFGKTTAIKQFIDSMKLSDRRTSDHLPGQPSMSDHYPRKTSPLHPSIVPHPRPASS